MKNICFLLALPLAAQAPLVDALKAGKTSLELRTRYEHAEDFAVTSPAVDPKTGNALTNRTLLGFESGELWGMKGALQIANVAVIGEERFQTKLNGKTQFANIEDGRNTQVTQAYIGWKGFKLGRQSLKMDNQRFMGAGDSFQMPRAYNGLTFENTFGTQWVELHAGHVTQFTDQSSNTRDLKMEFLRARFTPVNGFSITPFWVAVEETSTPAKAAESVQHFGLRLDATFKGFLFDSYYAQQKDYRDSVGMDDPSYMSVAAGYSYDKKITLKVGREVVEGAKEAGKHGFYTPMASLHNHFGWADRIAQLSLDSTKPGAMEGIKDTYVQLQGKFAQWAFEVQFHDLKTESDTAAFSKYGTDLSASLTWNVTKHYSLMAKYADYKGDDAAKGAFSKDMKKFWLVSTFKF